MVALKNSVGTCVFRGNMRIITVGIALDLMSRLEAAADRLHISRVAFINMALARAIEQAEQ